MKYIWISLLNLEEVVDREKTEFIHIQIPKQLNRGSFELRILLFKDLVELMSANDFIPSLFDLIDKISFSLIACIVFIVFIVFYMQKEL